MGGWVLSSLQLQSHYRLQWIKALFAVKIQIPTPPKEMSYVIFRVYKILVLTFDRGKVESEPKTTRSKRRRKEIPKGKSWTPNILEDRAPVSVLSGSSRRSPQQPLNKSLTKKRKEAEDLKINRAFANIGQGQSWEQIPRTDLPPPPAVALYK